MVCCYVVKSWYVARLHYWLSIILKNTSNLIYHNMFQVYELDGSTHDKAWVMQAYRNITLQFVHDQIGNFSGAKIIFSQPRYFSTYPISSTVVSKGF